MPVGNGGAWTTYAGSAVSCDGSWDLRGKLQTTRVYTWWWISRWASCSRLVSTKSGATEELLCLVPCAKARGTFLASVTFVPKNPLAGVCDMNVHLPLERELCPFDLAPVTSTAIQIVFGDTIAVALMAARNLTKEEYGANHPAGRIGKSLYFRFGLLKVKDVMKKKDELPVSKEGDFIMDQLVELTSKGCGCLLVVDECHRLIGTFTDGDLRRTLKASGEDIFKLSVGEMCNVQVREICCLPNDLVGAVRQSGETSASFVTSGGTRAVVRASRAAALLKYKWKDAVLDLLA
ncbi:unnamed protein product [Eruca vesicaria subsp. sativa]|uniref:CBS domain-containing protein n=1 Tax=Eruca vesicaria subsp. sativa TaxID=29727 RepID=A0ABC8LEQ7_ERUVS|nr:unnamed protein product [Eruca vesicaria subsp. sativa]